MNVRSRIPLVLALLIACALLGLAGRARADVNATFEVSFHTKPHWVGVEHTQVQEIRQGERPDYDIFKCKGRYYVRNADGWFVSKHGQGRFVAIEERLIPEELSKVPSDHWRNYPPGWADKKDKWQEKWKDKDHGKHHDHGDDRGNH